MPWSRGGKGLSGQTCNQYRRCKPLILYLEGWLLIIVTGFQYVLEKTLFCLGQICWSLGPCYPTKKKVRVVFNSIHFLIQYDSDLIGSCFVEKIRREFWKNLENAVTSEEEHLHKKWLNCLMDNKLPKLANAPRDAAGQSCFSYKKRCKRKTVTSVISEKDPMLPEVENRWFKM